MTCEIRRGRQVLCVSSIPLLGYSRETIRDMLANGLTLYQDGKCVKTKEI